VAVKIAFCRTDGILQLLLLTKKVFHDWCGCL
jgi:hypothetical protein